MSSTLVEPIQAQLPARPADRGDPAILVENISKTFKLPKGRVFKSVGDISFRVEKGTAFGLLGPNGAGKSTLIRMLTTLIPITSGRAVVWGHDVATDPNGVRQQIGVIPQAPTSDGELSVYENLSIFAQLYGVPTNKRKAIIAELLESVNLIDRRNSLVKTLSGGMRRRVEIARGLLHNPKILFLDEPTAGLDPVSRVAVWEMIVRLQQTRDLTVLITTHYMDEADRLCDRIAIVNYGYLVALDTPKALKQSIPGNTVIEAQFTNVPEDWCQHLEQLPGVRNVQPEAADMYRVLTDDGPRTTIAMVEAAVRKNVQVKTLSVESTTLNDVFVYYTGRGLRD